MPNVLVVGAVREQGLALLRARPDVAVRLVPEGDPPTLISPVADCDAILVRTSRITANVIAAAPGLKVVARHGVGYDNVDLEALNRRGIALAVAATANKVAVAEHAVFMMLELVKRGRAYDQASRTGNWNIRNSFSATELYEKTLLVVGLGRIGKEVAKRALPFGMRVLAFDPYQGDEVLEEAGCERAPDLEAALAEADFVSLHLPLSVETRNIIDARALSSMKPSAVLINTARGGLVDEQALFEALEAGRIRAAGLDVFEQEPPPDNHPLLRRDDVLVSPHSAGVTRESTLRMATEAAQNILDVLDGRLDPDVIVNLDQIRAAQ